MTKECETAIDLGSLSFARWCLYQERPYRTHRLIKACRVIGPGLVEMPGVPGHQVENVLGYLVLDDDGLPYTVGKLDFDGRYQIVGIP